jgi:hypothetical protein
MYFGFKRGCPLAGNAKYVEEAIPKGFGFGIFAGFISPFLAECKRSVSYFV